MRVKFTLENGSSVADSGWLDTLDDLGFDEQEWEEMSVEEKQEEADRYFQALGMPAIHYEEEG